MYLSPTSSWWLKMTWHPISVRQLPTIILTITIMSNQSLRNIGINHIKAIKHYRADSRLAPSQWETALQCNAVSHWPGANLDSALHNVWESVGGPQSIYLHLRSIFSQLPSMVRNHLFNDWSNVLRKSRDHCRHSNSTLVVFLNRNQVVYSTVIEVRVPC